MGRNARNTVTTILMILALLAFGGGSANADIMITVSPQCGGVGDTVTISADSTSGGQFFRYFVNTLSHCGTTQRNWQIIKDWSTDKTATWVLGEAGIHTFVVQVADDTTQSCVLEQMGATYDVGGADCFHPTEVMLTPASGVVNEPVTITAVTEGTNLQYRLYVREGDFCDPTQDLTFTLLEDWTNANSFTFTPAAAGVYTLIIWATSDINDSCVGQGGVVYVVAEPPIDITTMTPEQRAAITGLQIAQDSIKVSFDSPPTATFLVTDASGRPVVGIESLIASDDRFVRFTMAKLVAGTNGDSDSWYSYVRDADSIPTYDSPRSGGTLVANANHTYSYTFAYDVSADAAFDNSVTHRLGGQIGNSDSGLAPLNIVYDFVPNQSAVTTTRDIAMTSSCNECHVRLVAHGRRFEVGYCVTCHNPGLVEGGDSYDMSVMVHKIHAADPDWRDGFAAEVTYPQDLRNCRKCHNGADAETPQGDNWKNKPSREACGACHRGVNFDTGEGHAGGPQADNSFCAACHGASQIENNHLTANATPNNPNLPSGVPRIAYSISDVTVDGNGAPTITFTITADGSPLDVTNLPSAYSSSPSFLLAWAESQDGVASPSDYNNLGRKAGQPISVSIADVVSGTDGSVTYSSDGSCTATLNATFPPGASLRAVGLQGYYQIDATGDGESDYSLHTPSVLMPVHGDGARRTVVDSSKCANCHEWFEGHGGNRVLNMQICVMCHVPNLSSSGREINTPSEDVINALGPDTLSYPEATQNFKDMIHGIHSAAVRTTDYQHVRNRNNGIYYNWSEVTFPADPGNCLVCHEDDTYELPLDENVLMTTNRTTGVANGMDGTPDDVASARETVPNDTDWVITPIAAACYACHTSEDAVAHMEANGGAINSNRSTVLTQNPVESCTACHGSGRDYAVETVHTALDD